MIASREWSRGTLLLLAALLGLWVWGCSKKSTAPAPRGSISGRVVHVSGHAAGGVDVSMISISGTAASLDLVVADTLGRFSFTQVTPGTYVLYSRDFSDSCDADTLTVPNVSGNPAADTASTVLTLVPGGTLAGTATLSDRADSKGIALAVDHLLAVAVADSATGSYHLHDVPPGNWVLRATCAAHADQVRNVTINNPGDTVQVAAIQLVPGTPSGTVPLARLLEHRLKH